MLSLKNLCKKALSLTMAAAVGVMTLSTTAFAAELPAEAGTYSLNAELSCYISVMGGIEFADGMFQKAEVTVDETGDAKITVSLGTGNLTIYGVDCNAFIDAATEKPGYYDAAGNVQTAEYTLSSQTALNPSSTAVNYVDSVTFPVSAAQDTYYLWLYVNSNVMGCQFGDGKGSGSSNKPGESTPYTAKLTVDWDQTGTGSDTDSDDAKITDTATVSTEIVYDYQAPSASYEVEIPETLNIAAGADGVGDYTVKLGTFKNFAEGDYVTVTAPASGTLLSGSNTASYTNALTNSKLTAQGQSVSGKLTIATPPASGTYKGTLTFTINYHSAK